MAASTQVTSTKSVNKNKVVTMAYTYVDTTTKLGSDTFQIPNDASVVSLQVGAQATAQTIGLQGSNDGTTFAVITSSTKASAATAGVLVLARSVIGYFPYYKIYNDTGTASVTASLSFTLA
jgi:hypothetical protein